MGGLKTKEQGSRNPQVDRLGAEQRLSTRPQADGLGSRQMQMDEAEGERG